MTNIKQTHPSRTECLELLEKYNTPPHVKRHCIAVTDVAMAIGEALNHHGFSLDIGLIQGAGLIHDIARVHDKHWEIGSNIAAELGYKQEAEIILNHMFYNFVTNVEDVTELDMVCLGDRLVKEDKYVGLATRMEYILNKARARGDKKAEDIIHEKTKTTRALIAQIEERIDMPLNELMKEKGILMNLNDKLDKLLKKVEKPAKYIGNEPNSIMKDPKDVELRFGFAFPDTYEIGMSYMGMQILYNILNKKDNIYCERVFAPNSDMETLMRQEQVPAFTVETKTPINELGILGFTLQYELSFTNILNILDLGNIPLRSEDRDSKSPLIIAGGPCAFNPEPLAEIIDVFLIGDGEELLPEFCQLYVDCMKAGQSRTEFLQKACMLTGVYVPAFYEPVYNEDGTIKEINKTYEGAPDRVDRAVIQDINNVEFPTETIVPFVETVHDRSVVETFRGCTRGCRFCQAGMIYRPVRERTPEKIIELAKKQLKSTGHEELTLLSLSTSDYSCFEPLIDELMPYCKQRNISLSLPSLRLDSFSFKVLQEIQEYRKSGLTFAPEAGSQRLRNIINKNITEENIYSSVEQAIELGWTHIKLYFMIGLPYETYEDLDGIAQIAQNIIDMNKKLRAGRGSGRFSVTVSVSNFVPKAHTPFQWAPQDTQESFVEKHNYLFDKLKIKGVTFNYHDTDTSLLEAVFARGDRKVNNALIRAFSLGCKFDGWTEHFHSDLWMKAFEETGIDPAFYNNREREYGEVLPWDMIDSCITKDFLKDENEKAKRETVTEDCRHSCQGCGMNKRVKCTMEGYYGKVCD